MSVHCLSDDRIPTQTDSLSFLNVSIYHEDPWGQWTIPNWTYILRAPHFILRMSYFVGYNKEVVIHIHHILYPHFCPMVRLQIPRGAWLLYPHYFHSRLNDFTTYNLQSFLYIILEICTFWPSADTLFDKNNLTYGVSIDCLMDTLVRFSCIWSFFLSMHAGALSNMLHRGYPLSS